MFRWRQSNSRCPAVRRVQVTKSRYKLVKVTKSSNTKPTWVSLSRLLLILGVLQLKLVSSLTGKLDVLATFLIDVDDLFALADDLVTLLDGVDGELPAISTSSAADEFKDFLKVPAGPAPLLILASPGLESEEWLVLC